jgi:hypothetical protein
MDAAEYYTSEPGQRELAAGVLKQAAQDLRRFHGAATAVERGFYYDAYSWVMSEDCTWPFSFLNVCRLLNREPVSLREELLGDLSGRHLRSLGSTRKSSASPTFGFSYTAFRHRPQWKAGYTGKSTADLILK